jgi:hypothetical protein
MPSFDTKSIAILFGIRNYLFLQFCDSSPVRPRVSPLRHMHSYADSIRLGRRSRFDSPSSARREACVAPRGMYTRRAAFILRTLVARRGNSAPLRIFSSLFPLFRPHLRSVRILRARSPSNLALRRFSCRRQLSLRLHVCADCICDTFGSVCREADSLESILGLLA